MWLSNSFSSTLWCSCLELCKNHLPLPVHICWADPKSSHWYQNYLMHFSNAWSFSFCCKCCDSHLSGLLVSLDRRAVYFDFKMLPLWNSCTVRLFRARAEQMMSDTLGSLFYSSPKILEVLLQCINCTRVLALVRCKQRAFQGCLCSGWPSFLKQYYSHLG